MKKYIFSVLMAAMAAFTFSSCEDVPAPYTMPEKPADGGSPTTGKGSESDPYTVAEAIEVMKAGTAPTTEVYLSGIISNVISYNATYTSITYNISDNGKDENTIQVYSGKGLNGADFSSKDDLKVGQKVLVKGIIKVFVKNETTTIYEVDKTSSIIKIEGEGNTPAAGEAKGTGTEADPFNSVAANNYTKALEAGKVTDQEFYIKGKIQRIQDQFNAQYGNASVYIADDADSEQFYVFRINYFGGEKWKEGDGLLKEGDEIVVSAKLINYLGNTPETNQGGKLISVNGKTSISGGDTPSTPDTPSTSAGVTINGTTVTLASNATAGESIKVDLNTLGLAAGTVENAITLEDGTTITFEQGDGKSVPAFNASTKGIRVYANNKIVFNGKSNIAKIVMECDSYNGTDYPGNDTATVTFSGKSATYINVFNGTGGGTQLRVKTIEIFYAK